MNRLVEIRSYKLKPNSGAAFHKLVSEQSVPLLTAAKMDVVAFGQSVHDTDSYFLIRAYNSMEHLQLSQDVFYASAVWRQGPRENIIALIVTDTNAVMWLTPHAVEVIRVSCQVSSTA